MSSQAYSLKVTARARPVAAEAEAVEFDALRDPRTWIHGRFKRGGFYALWWALCWAGRKVKCPIPAPWDLKGTYPVRASGRARMRDADDFLVPAPLGFSLGDDPRESPYFNRPLHDAFKQEDARHAALFAFETEAVRPPPGELAAAATKTARELVEVLERGAHPGG